MSYIGNQVTSVPFVIDTFSGDNVTTAFGPMVRSPASVASIAVYISGVYRTPGVDYTIDSNFIFFTNPPATGTNNIVVHHLGDGVMATQVPADGSVTPGKLAGVIIRANNIVAGQITGNLLGTGSVSGNNIGTGAISANNFAGGGITSNVLASNLTVSVARVTETININSAVVGSNSASGVNVNIDILNTTVYYFSSNTTGNVSFNLRGNNTTTFDQSVQVGNTVSVVVTLRHNTAAYRSGVNVMIDGGYINTTRSNPDLATGNILFYSGNTGINHSVISQLESNVIAFNVIKKASNSYIVYASSTLFGLV